MSEFVDWPEGEPKPMILAATSNVTMSKPLHVRVAEALGWKLVKPYHSPRHSLSSPDGMYIGPDGRGCSSWPRFDNDWHWAGPVIEKYEIAIYPHESIKIADGVSMNGRWEASTPAAIAFAATPLVALCELILALKDAGKLG